MHTKHSYLLFSDVKGYSQLEEAQLKLFCGTVAPKIFSILSDHRPFHTNSWGDAFLGVFEDAVAAAEASLALRDYFRNTRWIDIGLPDSLGIRISLHSGRIFAYEDATTNRSMICGREVNRAARIEPIVPVGEVFTTNLMARTLADLGGTPRYECDRLGFHPVAKEWGAEELYRLRRPTEEHRTLADLELPELLHLFRIPKQNDSRNARMRSVLAETHATYSLLALSGFSYLHEAGINWRSGIRSHLEQRCPMRVLLMHPDGEEARARRRAENRDVTDPFLKVPLGRLAELIKKYPLLDIRLTRSPIYCSLFVTPSSAFYDPYHLGCFPHHDDGQNQFLVIEFGRGDCYDLLNLHFEFLWGESSTISVTQVLTAYRREIGD